MRKLLKMFSKTPSEWDQIAKACDDIGLSIPNENLDIKRYANSAKIFNLIDFNTLVEKLNVTKKLLLATKLLESVGISIILYDNSITLVSLDTFEDTRDIVTEFLGRRKIDPSTIEDDITIPDKKKKNKKIENAIMEEVDEEV